MIPVMEPPAGERFAKFIRTQKLGAGGMGEVWKAWDTELSRWVALKFLKGGDPEEVARFRREAQVAGGLSHPNIAATYEATDQYIAMQYIEGQTLRTASRRDRRQVARVVRDAARALAFAHERDVVHRDVKPDNLMVTPAGHVYVMDFGLARQVKGPSNLSVSGLMVGTPAYMAPEQARGERADARADVYGLGATLYELLTDRPPFRGGDVMSQLMKVLEEEPQRPRTVDARIDPDLETIALKCLEKDKVRRYATAGELADDLDRWLAGEAIRARPASAWYRLRKTVAKRRSVVLGLAGACAAIAVTLAIVLPMLRRTSTELSSAQARLVEQMRSTSAACLDAALARRREGDLDGMRRYARQVESACADVTREAPGLAEPRVRLGRMYRALMRFDDALAQQEEALRLEPAHAEARYERGLLRIRRYESCVEAQRAVWRTRQSSESPAEPPRRELEDDQARRWKAAAREDLGGRAEAVARALSAWLEGQDRAAEELLKQAVEEAPTAEEAWEWLGRLAADRRDYGQAAEVLGRARQRDRGYVPVIAARARALFADGYLKASRGEPAEETYRGAVAEFGEAIRLAPGSAEAWRMRGGLRVNWPGSRRTSGPTRRRCFVTDCRTSGRRSA